MIKESQQLFASKYQRVLPTEEELIAEIEREKRLLGGTRESAPTDDEQDETST